MRLRPWSSELDRSRSTLHEARFGGVGGDARALLAMCPPLPPGVACALSRPARWPHRVAVHSPPTAIDFPAAAFHRRRGEAQRSCVSRVTFWRVPTVIGVAVGRGVPCMLPQDAPVPAHRKPTITHTCGAQSAPCSSPSTAGRSCWPTASAAVASSTRVWLCLQLLSPADAFWFPLSRRMYV